QGFQGDQGNQGFQGNQGPRGYQGFQGNQGNQGFQGDQGNQGFQGNQGPRGYQGFQGNQGNQGDQGFQGNQGSQGARGPVTTYYRNSGPQMMTATVSCDAGDVATGGGFMTDTGSIRDNFPIGPVAAPNGWQASTTADNPQNITAYVVCADITP
ncbi:hypothetical protein ACFY13_18555, partial [Streptomyces mirabilis]